MCKLMLVILKIILLGGWKCDWSASGSGWPNFSGPYSSVINDNGRLKATATTTF